MSVPKPWARPLLVVVLALLVVGSWFPFRPALPAWRRAAPTSSNDALVFGGRSIAWNPAPDWLPEAIDAEAFRLDIEARTSTAQDGPARLFTISESVDSANLTVAQEGLDLIVRLRREGSTELGTPPFVVPDLFADGTWHKISIEADAERFRVDVDGRNIAGDQSPALVAWDPAQSLALGDEPAGDRGWKGELRRADISAGNATIDLLKDRSYLSRREWVLAERIRAAGRAVPQDPLRISLVRAVAWATAGALASALNLRRTRLAALVALPATLTCGKFFIASRDPRLSDTLVGTAAIAVGWAIARLIARRPPSSVVENEPNRPACSAASEVTPATGHQRPSAET